MLRFAAIGLAAAVLCLLPAPLQMLATGSSLSGAALADDDDGGFRGGRGLKFGLRFLPRIARMPRLFGGRGRARRAATYNAALSKPVEIVAIGLSADDIARLEAAGFRQRGQREIGMFNSSLTRLEAPGRMGRRRALRLASASAPGRTIAINEVYGKPSRKFYEPEGEGCGARCEFFELTAWSSGVGRCSASARIGVVDTGADVSHPALAGTRVTSRTFRSTDRVPSDAEHGTAVVSLLVGNPASSVNGLAPGAHVFHADAFHGDGEKNASDVFDLVAAIDWLVAEDVGVLNLSLSGPDNEVLKKAVIESLKRGTHVVAAAGRPDRGRTTGYPARYEGVIAVSAVDNRLRPSRLSMRGQHIAFAAPGVGIMVADASAGLRMVDGTSFATPFVTAAFAAGLGRRERNVDLIQLLALSAKDLGAPGRDAIYGWGLVRYDALPSC